MDLTRSEIKITIAKLLEVAYSKDKGMTTKIMAKIGNARLTVDQDGAATLSGTAGILTFSGKPVLDKIGVKLKKVSVDFTNEGGTKIGYRASVSLYEIAGITVIGEFDLEALMLSCSGLLCIAARAMKGRSQAYEMELQRIMGM